MRKKIWIVLLCLLLAAGFIRGQEDDRVQKQTTEAVHVTAPFQPQYTPNQNPQSSVNLAADLCGITDFRKQYKTGGNGRSVALIDSGIDLAHEAFYTSDICKVPVYRDYTSEGKLYTVPVKQNQGGVTAGGLVYRTGGLESDNAQYRLGFLPLDTIQPRMIDVGDTQVAVLVTAQNGSRFNCVYVDTNQNCDFTDEKPLHPYIEQQQYIQLPCGDRKLNVVLTEISSDGSVVQLTADTLGHVTFLAGLIAGNSREYKGLAPEAQLFVYKIFNRDGQSSQKQLAEAVSQAVTDGADCINLSLSIPKEEPLSTELIQALQKAYDAEIPVVAAVGNYGPGINTVSGPARIDSVIAVGSYGSPEQYALDRQIFLQQPFIADYSGRGTLNGADGPLITAPSGILSTVPRWYTDICMYDYGTSISAAIATAAICHVQEAAEKRNFSFSVEQLQNLLSIWAKDMGFSAAEQGYGALYLGELPQHNDTVKKVTGTKSETVVYSKKDRLLWPFSVPQGQSCSWYIEVPVGSRELSAVMQINQMMEQEEPVAMGRCRITLYSPDGLLMDQSLYLGASYSDTFVTADQVSAILPQAGIWEIVITSADNLSQYHHLESQGVLKAEIK